MPQPFTIAISEGQLDDLRRRIRAVRLGPPPANEPWESGVDYSFLGELIEYWAHQFDWRERERWLNSFPHYLADIDGTRVHFVHVEADRRRYERVIPIVVSHGWPYSFVEFLDFSTRLTDPSAQGLPDDVAFDVVIPSLPGFGFSAPPADGWFTGDVIAGMWHRLMTDELGHARYATYGEDVGTTVSDWIGALHPSSVLGLFSTHAAFPPDERAHDLSPAEQEFRTWLEDKWRGATGYSAIQSTRPDTLAVGLNDSPAGLLAWLVEKFREWSLPEFCQSWPRDDILTTVSLYWFTETIGTSFLPYFHGRNHERPLPLVEVPVGVAVQWGERGFPREYAERTYTDLRQWEELTSGGHFTAKQSPDLVASAMCRFFSELAESEFRE
jgi:epoxide hydrolase